jgi:hypothetical protein
MNKELLKRWVAALRSGEYQQCTGALTTTKDGPGTPIIGYCCLGVLQAIEPSIEPDSGKLDSHDMRRVIGGHIDQYTLVAMNDPMGKTFPEIADYIEKKYLNNEEDK